MERSEQSSGERLLLHVEAFLDTSDKAEAVDHPTDISLGRLSCDVQVFGRLEILLGGKLLGQLVVEVTLLRQHLLDDRVLRFLVVRQEVGIDVGRMADQTVGDGECRMEVLIVAHQHATEGIEAWHVLVMTQHREHHGQSERGETESEDEGDEVLANESQLLGQQVAIVVVEACLLFLAEGELQGLFLVLLEVVIELEEAL